MFKDAKVFSSFSVDDTEKAKQFYGNVLGLEVVEDPHMQGLLKLHLATGGIVMIYPRDNHVPATYTVLNIPVEDIEKVVDELTKKGVKFQQYTGELQTDEKGIARGMGPTIAWFTDPAGNIISVIESKQS